MKSTTTILIVDDEFMMRDLLSKILARDGYNLVTAQDGEEALQVLEGRTVDIVITDIKMPKLDGFGLLKEIKSRWANTTVIIMTAYGDTYTVKDALLLGADEYVTKPFKSYEISLVVERAYWRLLSAASAEGHQPL